MDLRLPHRFDPSAHSDRVLHPDYLHLKQQQKRDVDGPNEYQVYTLTVDSSLRDRTQYHTAATFRVYLQSPITNVLSAELLTAEIPNVAYTITERNQRFVFEEDLNGIVRKSFSLPTGHYDAVTLCAEIERLMNVFTDSQMALPDTPYSVVCPTDRNKAIFNANDPNITRFRILFSEEMGTAHGVLGFDVGPTPWNVETVPPEQGVDPDDPLYSNAIMSTGYMDTAGDLYVFLCSPELENNFHEVTYSKNPVAPSLPPFAFGRMQMTGPPGSAVFYNTGISARVAKKFLPPISKLSSLEFRWVRRDGTPVDFKNLENSFTIAFTCVSRSLGNPQFVNQMTA